MKPAYLLCLIAISSALVLGGASTAVGFDCRHDANNLLNGSNCHFSNDVAAWSITADLATHLGGDGDPMPGCAELVCTSCTEVSLTSVCVSVSPSTSYGAGFRVRDLTQNASDGCGVVIRQYESVDCSGPDDWFYNMYKPTADSWTAIDLPEALMSASTQSVRLTIGCVSEFAASHGIRVDNAYFGQGLTVPVELQSFSAD